MAGLLSASSTRAEGQVRQVNALLASLGSEYRRLIVEVWLEDWRKGFVGPEGRMNGMLVGRSSKGI
jgi:hypothetical protein